jgi:hypothetical protein
MIIGPYVGDKGIPSISGHLKGKLPKTIELTQPINPFES